MKQELEQSLVQRYPKIFCDYHGDPQTTCMTWGFECGDGWYSLIDQSCRAIQHHLDSREKRGSPVTQVVASQVKEKFGTMRFYYDGGDQFVDGVVALMELLSATTCEVCGNPGTRATRNGWIRTVCKDHE